MVQMDMQGDTMPVFLPIGVSGVGIGVGVGGDIGRGDGGVVVGYRESQNGEDCKGIVGLVERCKWRGYVMGVCCVRNRRTGFFWGYWEECCKGRAVCVCVCLYLLVFFVCLVVCLLRSRLCFCVESAFARLRFLRGAHRKGRHGLCMMTGAKHRVRSTRGARGSNPSQKTPRQRSARSALYLRTGEFIPTRSRNRGSKKLRA